MPRHGDLAFTRVSHAFVRPVAQVELQEDSQEFKGILFEASVMMSSEPVRDALKDLSRANWLIRLNARRGVHEVLD